MSRSLFVAWRSGLQERGRWGPVGRLDRIEDGYRFGYTRGARNLPGFVPFAGMSDLDQIYESDALFPLFANRLLARSRPEYEAYLSWSGFSAGQAPDPLAILSVTEGRRMTDALEVFACPRRDVDGRYACVFFLHGLRHMGKAALEHVGALQPGALLALQPEPKNPYDPHGMAVFSAGTSDGTKIGFVPRFLARDVAGLLQSVTSDQITLTVHRLNPHAPLQQRLLCVLNAPWPAEFEPCASADYQLIADSTAALAA